LAIGILDEFFGLSLTTHSLSQKGHIFDEVVENRVKNEDEKSE
jgi:hypothetical protein